MSTYDYSSYYGGSAPPAAGGYPDQQYAAGGAYAAAPPGYASSSYAYGAPGAYAGADEVRTIFITGFPQDVKERELNNLLRFVHGYEASQMTWKNNLAQGFALFSTGALARAACDAITGLQFDEVSLLRCEMARKNMYVKEMEPANKRARTGVTSFAPGASYGPAAAGYRPPGPTGDNPPCNTLFVGNLTETVNEGELNALFATMPGFRQLKVVRGRNTTAFVEFDSIENATQAHNTQQNAQLTSNADRGGLRIQYSRNPFGRKRDYAGGMIDPNMRQPDYMSAPVHPGGEPVYPGAEAVYPGAPVGPPGQDGVPPGV